MPLVEVTSTCDTPPICYGESALIEKYLNSPHVKQALHIPDFKNFTSVDLDLNQAFDKAGDQSTSTSKDLREVIERGVGVLVYNGNLDVAMYGGLIFHS